MAEEVKAENQDSSSEIKSFEDAPVKIEPCLLSASLEKRQIRIQFLIPFVQISDIVECDDYTIEFVQRMRIHRLHVNKKEDIHYLKDCKKMVDLFWTTGLHKLQKDGRIPPDEAKPLAIDELGLDDENNSVNDDETKPNLGPVPALKEPEGLKPTPKEAFTEQVEEKKDDENNGNNNEGENGNNNNNNNNPTGSVKESNSTPKDDNLNRESLTKRTPIKLEPLQPPGSINNDENEEEKKE